MTYLRKTTLPAAMPNVIVLPEAVVAVDTVSEFLYKTQKQVNGMTRIDWPQWLPFVNKSLQQKLRYTKEENFDKVTTKDGFILGIFCLETGIGYKVRGL